MKNTTCKRSEQASMLKGKENILYFVFFCRFGLQIHMWVSHPLLITVKEPPEGRWNRDITFKGHSYLVLSRRRQAYYDQHCVCEIGGTLFSGIYYEMNWKLKPTLPTKKGQKLWKGKTTSIYSSFASDAFCRYGLNFSYDWLLAFFFISFQDRLGMAVRRHYWLQSMCKKTLQPKVVRFCK